MVASKAKRKGTTSTAGNKKSLVVQSNRVSTVYVANYVVTYLRSYIYM